MTQDLIMTIDGTKVIKAEFFEQCARYFKKNERFCKKMRVFVDLSNTVLIIDYHLFNKDLIKGAMLDKIIGNSQAIKNIRFACSDKVAWRP